MLDEITYLSPSFNDTTVEAWEWLSNFIAHFHDDVIKWKHFPRYWPFVRGIHRSPVNSAHKGQWRGALMFPLICVWINGWVNNREAGDLRRKQAHYDVIVMYWAHCYLTMLGLKAIHVGKRGPWWRIWQSNQYCILHEKVEVLWFRFQRNKAICTYSSQ